MSPGRSMICTVRVNRDTAVSRVVIVTDISRRSCNNGVFHPRQDPGDRERDGCWGGSEMRGFCRGNAVVSAAAAEGALVALVACCTSGGGSTTDAQAAGTGGAA